MDNDGSLIKSEQTTHSLIQIKEPLPTIRFLLPRLLRVFSINSIKGLLLKQGRNPSEGTINDGTPITVAPH